MLKRRSVAIRHEAYCDIEEQELFLFDFDARKLVAIFSMHLAQSL